MKEILYKSTRGTGETLKASEAILKGLADDGGLFVPTEIPKLEATIDMSSLITHQLLLQVLGFLLVQIILHHQLIP